MKIVTEDALIKKADTATLKLIHMWHQLSKMHFGYSMEIMIANRRDNKDLKEYPGRVNTASLSTFNNKVVLCVWLESLENIDPIILTQEIGHLVLKLQGFRSVIRRDNINSPAEIMLNSVCHHPALYNLQRRVGHDPQTEIDSRAREDLLLVGKNSPKISDTNFYIILMLVDDVYNASNKISRHLLKKAKRFNTKAYEKIRLVNNIFNKYDLLKPEEALKCSLTIIEELNMGSNWVAIQDIEKFKKTASRKL